MTNFAQEMFEDMKEYFPDIAEDVERYYAMSERQLCVTSTDGTKIVYNIYSKTLRIFSPDHGVSVDVRENEEEWQRLFFKNLKKKIDESGYSYSIFSERVGIHRNTLSHYVNGTRMPTAVNLAKIARFLGYPIECFFTFSDENE